MGSELALAYILFRLPFLPTRLTISTDRRQTISADPNKSAVPTIPFAPVTNIFIKTYLSIKQLQMIECLKYDYICHFVICHYFELFKLNIEKSIVVLFIPLSKGP